MLTVLPGERLLSLMSGLIDVSLVEDKVSGASSAGAGCFTFRGSRLWAGWRWHLDEDVGEDAVVSACRGFCSVPGPLQSIQRAEFWCVILALQANDGIHLGVDNLGVVRHVGRLLDGRATSRPVELVKDGDLILLIERVFLRLRVMLMRPWFGLGELVIWIGWVMMELMRLPWWIIDARSNYSGVCARWRPVVLGLHRLFIAIARAVVNHDGVAGTSLDPMVCSVGGAHKRRRVVHAVRDRAFLPGPAGVWDGEWGIVAATHITCHNVEL